jgi:hypothetical protein
MLIEIGGWIGAVVLLAAYFLVSRGRVDPQGVLFQGLNLGASLLLMANSWVNRAYPSAFVNLIWMGIGGYALYSARRKAAGARAV